MGKVKQTTARKEWRCSKCGKVIAIGETYLRGEMNFARPIIRCKACGLKHWEVTTSEYKKEVGRLQSEWSEIYGVFDYTHEEIIEALEGIRDDAQDRLDNMPEPLQESSTGELLQERIDSLDEAIQELENIDIDTLKEEALERALNDHEEKFNEERASELQDEGYDAILEYPDDDIVAWVKDDMTEYFNDDLISAIDEALGYIEC